MLNEEILNLKVIKRNGKKVEFDGAKIALAIKKGFDSLIIEDEEPKYSEKDVQKVYKTVIKEIEKNYTTISLCLLTLKRLKLKISKI